MSNNPEPNVLPRGVMARMVFGWLLVIFIYFWWNNALVHQWRNPPLIFPEADNLFWLLHMFYLPQWIIRHETAALLFDVVMVASAALFFVYPLKNLAAVVCLTCLWIFHVCFSSAAGHHYAHFGMLILPLPFIFRKPLRFWFMWQLARYWVLWLFLSAGLYKFYYGGFFHEGNMATILKIHHAHPLESAEGNMIVYLVSHPGLAQVIYQAGALLQVSMVIGFFTRKFDVILATLLMLFHVSNFFLLHVAFWENFLTVFVLLPWKQIENYILNKQLKRKRG